MQFSAKGSDDSIWTIDGIELGRGEDIGWSPTGGHHSLELTNVEGKVLDKVTFEVRGNLSVAVSE